jgi:hypothetical protein
MTALFRLLGPQGIAGLAVALCLAGLLAMQKVETRHWKRQSAQFEALYRAEVAAHAATVTNYRAAADAARAADRANAARVAAHQNAINERTAHDFDTRLAAARAEFDRLRREGAGAADPGTRGSAELPGLSTAAAGAGQAARQDRLPPPDALIATEQAIQLDELVKWVKAQHSVDREGEGRLQH